MRFGRRSLIITLCLSLLGLAGGCKLLDQRSPQIVAEQLTERTGARVDPSAPGAPRYPCPVTTAQTEDSAVALALANNAAFRETLCDLGIAQADIRDANMIPNPTLLLYAPVHPRPLESYLEIPIDAFYLRPKRVTAAKLDSNRVRETVIQAGLNLARDVRLAYADVLLAMDRQAIANDNEALRVRIAGLAEKRLKAGDANPVDVSVTRIDALRGSQEQGRTIQDVQIAIERLHVLLGYTDADHPLVATDMPLPKLPASGDDLVAAALQTRPDALAAAQAVEAAETRYKLTKCDWFRLFGNFYTFYGGNGAVQYRPGFRVTVPIFNWNEGKIDRAAADLDKAKAAQLTVHDRIVLEVRQAFLQCQQAERDLARWQTQIRPAALDAVAKAERSYQAGDTPLVIVLETSRQVIETRLREAQLRADLRKAFAELERSVGHKVVPYNPPTLEIELP